MTFPNKDELLGLVKKLSAAKVMVVGDIILDRYIWGNVERISPEAPVPVVEVSQTEDRLGGAGNVVRNLRSLGAQVGICGFIGNDAEGTIVRRLVTSEGVDTDGLVVDGGKPTTLKTRVIAHNQQVVRIDREKRMAAPSGINEVLAAIVENRFDSYGALVVSDYGKGAISKEVLAKVERGAESGRLSLKKHPVFVDPHPVNYSEYRKIGVAKPNRREAEIASGVQIRSVDDGFKAARILIDRWGAELMVVTLGEDGMIVQPAGDLPGVHLETTAREVFDVSGAGDTVTAVFTAALAVGASPTAAGLLANLAAGIVVSEVGTVAVAVDRLEKAINDYSVPVNRK